ncbi:MAG: PT domain-containing protein, partial [Desulfobulbaceae bacterium]|nr:PT domain-containing protein [Desulfobulbaceae bacterium]
MKKGIPRILMLGIVAVGLVVMTAETALRLAGMVDFPIYETRFGYIPAPNQSGRFLHKNAWLINEYSMGAGQWTPNGRKDILLLGDSVVWGGNPINQPDKLGPQLERALDGWRVWPIAAGSWGILNEAEYLDSYPEIKAETDVLVWLVNTGDLGEKSVWKSDFDHPRRRPYSALAYVFAKYVARNLPSKFVGGSSATEHAEKTPIIQKTVDKFHSELLILSASQPVSQSASQPVSQSASQPVSQSASQPVSQSASQPVS